MRAERVSVLPHKLLTLVATHRRKVLAVAMVGAAIVVLNAFFSDGLPEVYLGSIDGLHFAVPAKFVQVPVLYDGESDWTPPRKPKRDRTFADHIVTIEFYVDRDRPGVPQLADEGYRNINVWVPLKGGTNRWIGAEPTQTTSHILPATASRWFGAIR